MSEVDDFQKQFIDSMPDIYNPKQEEEDVVQQYLDSIEDTEEDDLEATQPMVEEEPKSFDTLAEDQNFVDAVNRYAKARFGEGEMQGDDETNEEFIGRFVTHARQFENNSVEMLMQLDYIRNASEEDRQDFSYIYNEYMNMPSFYEEGGADTGRALLDYTVAFASDPISWVTGGVGKLAGLSARKALQEAAKKEGIENVLKGAGQAAALKASDKGVTVAGGVLGAAEGVGSSAGVQAIEMESGLREEYDAIEMAIAGTIGGGLGAAGAKGVAKESRDVASKKFVREQSDILDIANSIQAKKAKASQAQEELFDPITGELLDREKGKQILRGISPETDITAPVVNKAIRDSVQYIAADLVKEFTDRGINTGQFLKGEVTRTVNGKEVTRVEDLPVADVLFRMVLQADEFNASDAVSSVFKSYNLTEKQFFETLRGSSTEAAQVLANLKVTKDMIKNATNLDPEFGKALKEFSDNQGPNGISSVMSRIGDLYHRLDRERRALMVTQLSTTIRNVGTGFTTLTANGAANLLESSLYHAGKGIQSAAKGQFSARGTASGIIQVIQDSFGMTAKLADFGRTSTLADALLETNPYLNRQINRTLAEADNVDQSLSRTTQYLNSLNMAQDVFFRKAAFLDSVERQLSRAYSKSGGKGPMDVMDVLAGKTALPPEVLQRAVDDALKFTYSYMPKKGKGAVESLAHDFVKLNERVGPLPSVIGLPIGTGAIPFPRFMTNSLRMLYEFSPANAFGAMVYAGDAGIRKAMKKEGGASADVIRDKLSKGIVGTSALMAAMHYRLENPEIEWYKMKYNEAGDTIDTRALFPIAPYLFAADMILRFGNGDSSIVPDFLGDQTPFKGREFSSAEILEGILGLQSRFGETTYVVDNLLDGIGGILSDEPTSELAGQRIGEYLGRWAADMTGGFATPLKMIDDAIATYDAEYGTARTSTEAEGDSFGERFSSAYMNRMKGVIPGMKGDLPEVESPTKEDTPNRRAPLMKQITGLTIQDRKTEVEKELYLHDFDYRSIFPSTGDKTADRLAKKHMGPLVDDILSYLIETDYYKNLTFMEQKTFLKKELGDFRSLAKEIAEQGVQGQNPFSRGKWIKSGKEVRGLAEQYYMQQYGASVEDMQRDDPDFDHYGFALQVGRAFRKGI